MTCFEASRSQRLSISTTGEDDFPSAFVVVDPLTEDSPLLRPGDRHIVRNHRDSIDRHYGPGTSVTLCNKYRDLILSEPTKLRKQGSSSVDDNSHQSNKQDWQTENEPVYELEPINELLSQMCSEAGKDE